MSRPLRACIVLVFLLAAWRGASAQSGAATVTMGGQVSAAVALSASGAGALSEREQVSVANIDATTIAVSISGSGDADARVRLPLRLRSNVGYRLGASSLSPDDLSVRLSVADVRATGKLVHANALAGVRLDDALADPRGGRALPPAARDATSPAVQNRPTPFALLTGPPVSKGGTFSSPDNAIEIVLIIQLRPRAAANHWSTQLTISAAPDVNAAR